MKKTTETFTCRICRDESQSKQLAEYCFDKCLERCKECIICGNKTVYDDDYGFKNSTPFEVKPQYNSKHDGEVFSFIICDECLDKFDRNRKL